MSLQLNSRSKILGDRYHLDRLIAQSNYSRIFLATDLARYRKCAVKQLNPIYPAKMRSQIESAFLHEVEISQEIAGKHCQLCQFYDYFIESGDRYLVREWIEGTTLEEKLRQQSKLSESETKHILSNILLVLKRIHSLKIVHNDIKPSNIILRIEDKLPVLIDFGIARKIDGNYGQKTIAGTLGYMSLEQAMGKVAVTNDLYSLGLTAIYLLTGVSPQTIDFDSQDNFWQQAKAAFDPQLVAVIDRAIASDIEQRFNSAEEMLTTLHSSPIKFVSSLSFNRFTAKLEYLSLIFVLGILGVWFYFNHSILQPDSAPVKIADSPSDQLLNLAQFEKKLEPTILETTNNALKKVIFVPGTSATTIVQNLGEPLWRRPGVWTNSIAWSYENIVTEGFDLGYLFDTQTNKLRQAEIAVPPNTDLSTLELAMNSFLATKSLPLDLQRGLLYVYQRQQNTYNFTAGNLEGIVQRNQQDRIYLAVWQADFH